MKIKEREGGAFSLLKAQHATGGRGWFMKSQDGPERTCGRQLLINSWATTDGGVWERVEVEKPILTDGTSFEGAKNGEGVLSED